MTKKLIATVLVLSSVVGSIALAGELTLGQVGDRERVLGHIDVPLTTQQLDLIGSVFDPNGLEPLFAAYMEHEYGELWQTEFTITQLSEIREAFLDGFAKRFAESINAGVIAASNGQGDCFDRLHGGAAGL